MENENNLNNKLQKEIYDKNKDEEIEYLEKIFEEFKKLLNKNHNTKKYFFCCCKKTFKNEICDSMDEVYETCASIQRKSFLINLKASQLFISQKESKIWIKFRFFFFIFLIILLFFLELLGEIFERIIILLLNNGKLSDYITIIIIFFVSIVLYFIVFIYSIIHHKYIEGELLFGKKKSQNVNYYYFLIEILNLCNALIFHSVWVLNRTKHINARFCNVYILINRNLMEASKENLNVDLVSLLNFFIFFVSLYIAISFSKIKICSKTIIYNENADFYGFNKNFYINFYLGCGCLIFIAKNSLKLIKDKKIDKDVIKKEKQKEPLLKEEEEQKEPLLKEEEKNDLILNNDEIII